MFKRTTMVVGPFQCNCQILMCPESKDAVVIDPGDEGPAIAARLQADGANVKYILHTHAHLDHCSGTHNVSQVAPHALVGLHQDDEWLYKNVPMQGQMFGMRLTAPPPVTLYVEHEMLLPFANTQIKILHIPGHSPGSVAFSLSENTLSSVPEVFTGDTLFYRSVGRTDLWMADGSLMTKSIKQKLFTLDDETLVHPGHGPSTKIADEKRENPFL